MPGLKDTALRAGFELAWLSQATALVRGLSRCRGVILSFNRVLPGHPADFAPNARAQVTPGFLEFVVARVRELGLDIVDLDEALRRLAAPVRPRGFVVVTFDGAWRDNLDHALPVLRRRRCPFTLYASTALVDGVGELWAPALEDIVADNRAIAVEAPDGEVLYLETDSLARKQQAYAALHRRMRRLPGAERMALLRDLAGRYGLDLVAHARGLVMDWDGLQHFADEPLCTIGAQAVHGRALPDLPEPQARGEIEQSLNVLAAQLDARPRHLAYPDDGTAAAGPREFAIAASLGLKSAVTTRPGGLYPVHAASPHALPRIVVSGEMQERRYVEVLATGALFSLPGRGGQTRSG